MLDPTQLADRLAADWLPGDDGPHPDTPLQSAQVFSQAVLDWFRGGQANLIPPSAPDLMFPVLVSLATTALNMLDPVAAGQMLANGVSIFMTGQLFGPGVSAPPLATAAAAGLIGTAFATLQMDRDARAQLIALAVYLMALTTLVSFPVPPIVATVI